MTAPKDNVPALLLCHSAAPSGGQFELRMFNDKKKIGKRKKEWRMASEADERLGLCDWRNSISSRKKEWRMGTEGAKITRL
jgi:hypothetical protein